MSSETSDDVDLPSRRVAGNLRYSFLKIFTDPITSAAVWTSAFIVGVLATTAYSPGQIDADASWYGALDMHACNREAFIDVHRAEQAELIVIGAAASLTLFFLASLATNIVRGRNSTLFVAATIFAQTVIMYGIENTKLTQCQTVTTPVRADAVVRIFMPLRYVYWLGTTPQIVIQLVKLSGLPDEHAMTASIAEIATILFGLFAAMTYKWSVLFIILSTASFGSFFVVMYVQICAYVRTRNEIVDGSTRRMVMIVGPISLAMWCSFPTVWLLSYTNAIEPATELTVWPVLDLVSKIVFTQIWLTGDFSRVDVALEAQLQEVERERAVADARNDAKRKFMRYIFHELRVPLNAITLGLEDTYETGKDVQELLVAAMAAGAAASASSASTGASPSLALGAAAAVKSDSGTTTSLPYIHKRGSVAAAVRDPQSGASSVGFGGDTTTPSGSDRQVTRGTNKTASSTPMHTGSAPEVTSLVVTADSAAVVSHGDHTAGHGGVVVTRRCSSGAASSAELLTAAYDPSVASLSPSSSFAPSSPPPSSPAPPTALAVMPSDPHRPGYKFSVSAQSSTKSLSAASVAGTVPPRSGAGTGGAIVGTVPLQSLVSLAGMIDTLLLLQTNAGAMSKLLDDFLSLEKIEEGKFEIEPVQFRVPEMVKEATAMFAAPLTSKRLILTVDLDPACPDTIKGDVHKLRQVLCNYISNAIKFSPVGGRIKVTVTVMKASRGEPHRLPGQTPLHKATSHNAPAGAVAAGTDSGSPDHLTGGDGGGGSGRRSSITDHHEHHGDGVLSLSPTSRSHTGSGSDSEGRDRHHNSSSAAGASSGSRSVADDSASTKQVRSRSGLWGGGNNSRQRASAARSSAGHNDRAAGNGRDVTDSSSDDDGAVDSLVAGRRAKSRQFFGRSLFDRAVRMKWSALTPSSILASMIGGGIGHGDLARSSNGGRPGARAGARVEPAPTPIIRSQLAGGAANARAHQQKAAANSSAATAISVPRGGAHSSNTAATTSVYSPALASNAAASANNTTSSSSNSAAAAGSAAHPNPLADPALNDTARNVTYTGAALTEDAVYNPLAGPEYNSNSSNNWSSRGLQRPQSLLDGGAASSARQLPPITAPASSSAEPPSSSGHGHGTLQWSDSTPVPSLMWLPPFGTHGQAGTGAGAAAAAALTASSLVAPAAAGNAAAGGVEGPTHDRPSQHTALGSAAHVPPIHQPPPAHPPPSAAPPAPPASASPSTAYVTPSAPPPLAVSSSSGSLCCSTTTISATQPDDASVLSSAASAIRSLALSARFGGFGSAFPPGFGRDESVTPSQQQQHQQQQQVLEFAPPTQFNQHTSQVHHHHHHPHFAAQQPPSSSPPSPVPAPVPPAGAPAGTVAAFDPSSSTAATASSASPPSPPSPPSSTTAAATTASPSPGTPGYSRATLLLPAIPSAGSDVNSEGLPLQVQQQQQDQQGQLKATTVADDDDVSVSASQTASAVAAFMVAASGHLCADAAPPSHVTIDMAAGGRCSDGDDAHLTVVPALAATGATATTATTSTGHVRGVDRDVVVHSNRHVHLVLGVLGVDIPPPPTSAAAFADVQGHGHLHGGRANTSGGTPTAASAFAAAAAAAASTGLVSSPASAGAGSYLAYRSPLNRAGLASSSLAYDNDNESTPGAAVYRRHVADMRRETRAALGLRDSLDLPSPSPAAAVPTPSVGAHSGTAHGDIHSGSGGGDHRESRLFTAVSNGPGSHDNTGTKSSSNSSNSGGGEWFVRFSVIDQGVGIRKDDQAKLFQPFNQIKAGALQKGNGTGLGLSICKRIVELSGGRVGIHSREGRGSMFFFQVPVSGPEVPNSNPGSSADEAAAAEALTNVADQLRRLPNGGAIDQQLVATGVGVINAPHNAPVAVGAAINMRGEGSLSMSALPPSTSGPASHENLAGVAADPHTSVAVTFPSYLVPLTTAVVVDDAASNRTFFGRMLARRGVTTIHYAEDGLQAVALLDGLTPSQVASIQCWFLDKEMPNCDGHGAARMLRKRGVTVPIFGVTGNALAEDRRQFVECGATAVIPKPVRAETLEATLAVQGLSLAPSRSRSTAPALAPAR